MSKAARATLLHRITALLRITFVVNAKRARLAARFLARSGMWPPARALFARIAPARADRSRVVCVALTR